MGNPITKLEQITLNAKSKSFLREISRWAFFFAILGFISIVFLLIVAVLIGTLYAPMINTLFEQQGLPSVGLALAISFFISALIYFIPVWYLFKFSRMMKVALATKNNETLADAFENLKSHFKFIGVFTIIVLSLYVLLIGFSLVAGSLV